MPDTYQVPNKYVLNEKLRHLLHYNVFIRFIKAYCPDLDISSPGFEGCYRAVRCILCAVLSGGRPALGLQRLTSELTAALGSAVRPGAGYSVTQPPHLNNKYNDASFLGLCEHQMFHT